jgi:hypothetical protein
VKSWFNANGCTTKPHGISACQTAADLYGFAPGTTGIAPTDIINKWNAYGCNETTTSDVTELCQNISNLYGTVAGVTWGIAPSQAQSYWTSHNCFDAPSCQAISDLMGSTPSSKGVASDTVYSWYLNNGCFSTPQFWNGDICQLVADNFSPADTGVNSQYDVIGFLPQLAKWDILVWWENNGCRSKSNTYHPRGHRRIAFTNGP